MRSPCPVWNSTLSSNGQLSRYMSRCGRSSCSVAGPGSSGTHSIASGLFREEDESPSRPKQPRSLGQPARRVAPDARAVLRDGEIERRVGQRNVFSTRLDERELDPGLGHDTACRVELRRRHVDSDRAAAAPCKPGGEVRRSAAELDDVEPVHFAEDPDVVLAHAEHPQVISASPHAARAFSSVYSALVFVQSAAVPRDVVAAQTRPSGKNSASSRRALAFESEPWTMFSEARARSRRGSFPGASRAGSSRPSSSARPRSPTRRSPRAQAPGPR